MDPSTEATLMEIFGVRRPGQMQGPLDTIDLNDPSQVDWQALARQYNLTPEQVQELQVPGPAEGPNLRQRLDAIRTRNGVEWGVDGNRVTGTVRY